MYRAEKQGDLIYFVHSCPGRECFGHSIKQPFFATREDTMTTQHLNIVSPKSLEKQLKLVESRMEELRAEIHELEKMRTACLILLGNVAEFPAEPEIAQPGEAATAAKATKKKADKRSASESTEENLGNEKLDSDEGETAVEASL